MVTVYELAPMCVGRASPAVGHTISCSPHDEKATVSVHDAT